MDETRLHPSRSARKENAAMTGLAMRQVGYLVLTFLALVPGVTFAQSGIAGAVRDTTGAVLPGVTVEATSPVLIEKARAVVTDGEGLYRILDLRPGVYAVTFSLPGFSTVRREGIALPASFTATVNAEMRVGAVEETVTVSGAAPLVDVQNVLQQRVLTTDVMENIPSTSRTPQAFMLLTPGVTSVRLGTTPGSVNELAGALHGASSGEFQITLDGDKAVMIGCAGSGCQPMRFNQGYIQEISVKTGAASAEQETGGLVSNIVPKEGGNRVTGYLYAGVMDASLQGDNLSEKLKAQGLQDVSRIIRNYDVTPAVGGPVVRDKLWFYSSFRFAASKQTIAGLYSDLDPNDWVYTPDLGRPAVDEVNFPDSNTRLTWQATPRNKVGVFLQRSGYGQVGRGLSNQLISPEASRIANHVPNVFGQIIWKSTVTSRLLVEAGYSSFYFDREQRRLPYVGPDAIAATDVGGVVPGIAFRAPPAAVNDSISDHWYTKNWDYKASATYVTGAHAFKTGLAVRTGNNRFSARTAQDMAFTLRSGVPISLLQTATPWEYIDEVKPNLGLFAQDQWTVERLTLNAGARFDYFRARALETHLPSTRWVPARDFPAVTDVPNWKDVSPRFGVAYDVFGNGKTALKATLNRYVNGEGTTVADANHPVVRSVLSITRTWSDANGDFVPDCVLVDPLANGECGRISNLNFGQNNPSATTYADDLLRGFGVRGYNWTTSAEIQHELFRGTSVTAGYYRRWAGNFRSTDNLLVTPADYDPFCVTAPVDPRLPGGGGYQVCGLHDVTPLKFGQVLSQVVPAKTYGRQTQIYDGFDVTTNARFPNGGLISGGVNIGRSATSSCFVVDSPQELLNCDVTPPFQPNFKIFGIYPVPWWGLQASAVLQIIPGPEITASYVARNAEVFPSLGRNLAAGASGTVTVPLIAPGTQYADSSNQIDVRFTKRFNVGPARIEGNLDIFNILNASGIQVHNNNFGIGWLQPRSIQLPRYAMLSAQVNF
jgi:hypothetical protein